MRHVVECNMYLHGDDYWLPLQYREVTKINRIINIHKNMTFWVNYWRYNLDETISGETVTHRVTEKSTLGWNSFFRTNRFLNILIHKLLMGQLNHIFVMLTPVWQRN